MPLVVPLLGLVSPAGRDSILSSRERISARMGPRLVSVQLVFPLCGVGLFPLIPELVEAVVDILVGLVEPEA